MGGIATIVAYWEPDAPAPHLSAPAHVWLVALAGQPYDRAAMAVGSRPLVPSSLAPGGSWRLGAMGRRRRATPASAGSSRSRSRASSSCCSSPRCRRWCWPRTGLPSLRLIVATLVGGALAAGGANAANMVIDRDIDRLMPRTQGRPLVTGLVAPGEAIVVRRAVLEVAAFALLWWQVNLLSAVLALAAMAFYVVVYTIWLKRTSTQNIVIGGAAGAVPVLVGWAAVTGGLAWAALRAVRRHLPVDAAALLGAGHPLRRRLPRRGRADAPGGRSAPRRGRPADVGLHPRPVGLHAGARARRRARAGSTA